MIDNLTELNLESIEKLLQEKLQDDKITSLKDLPPPDVFLGIKEAINTILKAIKEKRKITIVGDYDVDGVVATTILKGFFDKIEKDVDIILPNRFKDGYGLSVDIIKRVETDLIITVDNGISAIEAGVEAKNKGVDLVITDHHICPESLPLANAIVNPKQKECNFPESDIAGATVAWYLVAGLKKSLNLDLDLGSFLDIMAFAILADAMPLRSINRTLVKQGIKTLNRSKRAGIIALKKWLEIDAFTTNDIVFSINPRLNSAGRMDDAIEAFKFLTATTQDSAIKQLEELDRLNNLRKETEKEIVVLAKQQTNSSDNIIVVWGDDWHEGVIGIVASRLTELYDKPSIVFGIKDGIAKGSGRSRNGIDLLGLITKSSSILDGFGGHKQAVGMSCLAENLETFKESCLNNFQENINEKQTLSTDLLGMLPLKLVDMDLVNLLELYEPFGQAFPFPYFYVKDVAPDKIIKMGNEKIHMLLIFNINSNIRVNAIWFNFTKDIKEMENISFIYTVAKNNFRGTTTAQAQIKKVF